MRGSEIVAALRGIINTTPLNTLSIEDKVAIRTLLDIIDLWLFTPTYQVNAYHRAYYQLRVDSQRCQGHLRRSVQDSYRHHIEHHRGRGIIGSFSHRQSLAQPYPSYKVGKTRMACPLPTDAVIDYLSFTHRNIYRLPITPDQRCILKKYLRLIENELDGNRGVPGPPASR